MYRINGYVIEDPMSFLCLSTFAYLLKPWKLSSGQLIVEEMDPSQVHKECKACFRGILSCEKWTERTLSPGASGQHIPLVSTIEAGHWIRRIYTYK